MSWLDSHCHINDLRYKDDLDEVLENMLDNDVRKAMIISLSFEELERGKQIRKEGIEFLHSLGIFPSDVEKYSLEDLERFYEAYQKDDEIKAIGEIGLDYHYGKEFREKQIDFFKRQMQMAKDLDKPVIIHSRDASFDTLDIMNYYRCKGVLHCYSGSAEMARGYAKMGYYISLSGVVTFKNAKEPLQVIQNIPLDRLLIETDCPYLTPEPKRGQRNEPANVVYTGRFIAKQLGMSELLLQDIIEDNYRRLFEQQ